MPCVVVVDNGDDRRQQSRPAEERGKGRRSDVASDGDDGDDGNGDGDDGDVVDWTGVLYGNAGDPRRPQRRALR